MSQLWKDIALLKACAIEVHDLIHTARCLGCTDLLVKAFPTMPEHMRYQLYTGQRLLTQDADGYYITVINSPEPSDA